MSWHFSQALEAEFSAANCSDGEQFAQWKLTPIAPDDLCSDKMKNTFHRSPFGMMFAPSTDENGKALLTWFRADFPVRTSVFATESNEDLTESVAGFGARWHALSLRYDLVSSSWKTAQMLFIEDLPESSVILPNWGMCRNGDVFEPLILEPQIIEKDFSWLLTPMAQGWKAWTFRNPFALIRKNHADGNLQEQLMRVYQRMITPECAEILLNLPPQWSDSKPLATHKIRSWCSELGISW